MRRSWTDNLLARVASLHAGATTKRFFKAIADSRGAQDRLLANLVRQARDSDFGRQHHFAHVRYYADYVVNVPIHTYQELAPYIDRVRHGDVAALLHPGERVLMFALTSGTTADPKYIPVTSRVLADWRRGWNIWGLKALQDHPDCLLRSILQVTSPMNDHVAPSGVPCGAITGLLAATQKKLIRRYYTAPLVVAGIKDSLAKYYTIMRLAITRDVAWAVTANPATLLLLARTADQHRQQIIRDVHDGTLTEAMPVEGDIRTSLSPSLRPDPAGARRLEAVVREHGTLSPKDYWRLGFVAHWTGGTMGLYLPQFARYFGDVPSRDVGLIASEGRMSIPMKDGTPGGLLAVESQFFEFIPADQYGTARPTVLRSHEVREGEEYFLILTNASGLYRYDIGDRIRVVERMGDLPIIEFLSRDAHTSSLTGEKLTEDQVVAAMRRLGGDTAPIADFVLAPRWADVPYYRLYVESPADQTMPHLADQFDAALSEISVEYASKRKSLRLGTVEVVGLPSGSLTARDRELRRQRLRTSEQFKHRYLLSRPGEDSALEGAPHRGD